MLQSDTFLLCSPPPAPSHPLSSSCFLHFVAVFILFELVFFFFIIIFYFDFLCCPSSPLLKFPFPHSIFSALLLIHLLSPSFLIHFLHLSCLSSPLSSYTPLYHLIFSLTLIFISLVLSLSSPSLCYLLFFSYSCLWSLLLPPSSLLSSFLLFLTFPPIPPPLSFLLLLVSSPPLKILQKNLTNTLRQRFRKIETLFCGHWIEFSSFVCLR